VSVTVRTAVSSDWPGLWPMLADMGVRDDESSCRERFLQLAEDRRWSVVVAADGHRLLGYSAVQDHGEHLRAGLEGRVARLHELYVCPADRRTGIGRLLMEHVVGWAGERVRFLQWQAHESRSAPFYERLGFHGEPCPQPDFPEFEVTF